MAEYNISFGHLPFGLSFVLKYYLTVAWLASTESVEIAYLKTANSFGVLHAYALKINFC